MPSIVLAASVGRQLRRALLAVHMKTDEGPLGPFAAIGEASPRGCRASGPAAAAVKRCNIGRQRIGRNGGSLGGERHGRKSVPQLSARIGGIAAQIGSAP
jgi:hypothetical protein